MSRRPPVRPDPWRSLARLTAARIGLGRAGGSLPTSALLDFQLAHAQARDAVHHPFDTPKLEREFRANGWDVLQVRSGARDRSEFIARPDCGRILDEESRQALAALSKPTPYDAAFVVADGLSALAVERHAVALLCALVPPLQAAGWRLAPICIVQQGRVAIGDEIGALLPARLSVILIGERPGLTSPDSLGAYVTWNPMPGRTNAERNCVSNIRPQGLGYDAAAQTLRYLVTEARRRALTGVGLKDETPALPAGEAEAR